MQNNKGNKTDNIWTIAVPRNIFRAKLKMENFVFKPYFIQNDKLALGKTEADFNGIKLPVYDREVSYIAITNNIIFKGRIIKLL